MMKKRTNLRAGNPPKEKERDRKRNRKKKISS